MLIQDGVELFTTPEAAPKLGIQAPAVRNLISRGKILAVRIGRDNFVTQAEIERYLAEKSPTGWKAGRARKTDK